MSVSGCSSDLKNMLLNHKKGPRIAGDELRVTKYVDR
jgi:hypothetical protein